jgi:hypothetical protein
LTQIGSGSARQVVVASEDVEGPAGVMLGDDLALEFWAPELVGRR